MNNKKIPEEKRKFVAALDLTNGVLMIAAQIAMFFAMRKYSGPIFNKLFKKSFNPEMAKNIASRIRMKQVQAGETVSRKLPIEKEYKNTRQILERLHEIGCNLTVCTRSDLVLRDIDILKDMNAKVSISINTLDENFVKNCENTSPIERRFEALKKLHDEGIYTILCVSPIFPYITDFEEIVKKAKGFVDEYWFENLNLRQPYKTTILNFIQYSYPEYYEKYREIYVEKNREYWFFLKHNIMQYCKKRKLKYKIDFRHN